MAGRLLLLGANGFAGAHLRREAETAGYEVVGAARRPGAAELTADLMDAASLSRAIERAAPDAIANLAGSASVAESWRSPAAALEANAIGVAKLLDAVAQRSPEAQVLCISSGEAYGHSRELDAEIDESHPLRPMNPYGVSKVAMELVCDFHARRGLRISIARSFNHIGPGQSDSFAVSNWARQVAEAERDGAALLTLRVGAIEVERDFTDVRDTVCAYRTMLANDLCGTYNVCSGRAVALRDLIAMLDEHTTLELKLAVEAGRLRPDEPSRIVGSPTALTEATGWRPERRLEDAVGGLLDEWRVRLAR